MQRIYLSNNDLYSDNTLVLGLVRVEFLTFQCFVLTQADDLCCAWFVYHILYLCSCLEMRTSSVDWAKLCMCYLKTETELGQTEYVLPEDGDRIGPNWVHVTWRRRQNWAKLSICYLKTETELGQTEYMLPEDGGRIGPNWVRVTWRRRQNWAKLSTCYLKTETELGQIEYVLPEDGDRIGPNWVRVTWRRRQNWAKLSTCYLKTETESSLRNVVNRNRTMDNVQKYNTCISVVN
jgi:muconolactone delta-isomerase